MKKLLFLLLFIPLISFSQEYFFMDNGSYETTTTYMLSTNSSDNADNDLSISYVKYNVFLILFVLNITNA